MGRSGEIEANFQGEAPSERPPLTFLRFIKIHTEISGDEKCNKDDSPLVPDQVELTEEQYVGWPTLY